MPVPQNAPLHRGGELGAEFAGGEVVEGAEAAGEFDRGEAAPAIEPTQEIRGGAFAFLRIAFPTNGDEVAVGIVAGPRDGHDMIEAPGVRADLAQAIKTEATLTSVDCLAQPLAFLEIHFIEGWVGGISSGRRTSTTWPTLLRCTRRKAPWSMRR